MKKTTILYFNYIQHIFWLLLMIMVVKKNEQNFSEIFRSTYTQRKKNKQES